MAVVKGSKRIRPPLPTFTIDELRWEFLKRNKCYQKDFDRLQDLDSESKAVAEFEFALKWGIDDPIDWRIEEACSVDLRSNNHMVARLEANDKSIAYAKAVVAASAARARADRSRKFLVMVLDMNKGMPTKEQLWDLVKKHEPYSRRSKVIQLRTRSQLNRLIWILQMKEQGFTINQMAQILYPKSFDPNSKRSDVKRQIETANRYVGVAPAIPVMS